MTPQTHQRILEGLALGALVLSVVAAACVVVWLFQ